MGLKKWAGGPDKESYTAYIHGSPHIIAATTNRMITSNASIPTTMSPNRPASISLAPFA